VKFENFIAVANLAILCKTGEESFFKTMSFVFFFFCFFFSLRKPNIILAIWIFIHLATMTLKINMILFLIFFKNKLFLFTIFRK